MATPTDYIFTTGTCTRGALYQLIIDKLTAAGWTNISSLSSSDYVVMQSTGNTGDKNLLLNLRDASATAINPTTTTDYCAMSYRLQDTYVPGAAGVAGVFGRPALAWTNLFLAPVAAVTTTLGKDTVCNYHVYADASKLILEIEYPSVTGLGPQVIYMGEPDTMFVSDSASRGVLVACSSNGTTASSAIICNTSDTVASVSSPYAIAVSALLPAGDPNVAGKTMVSSLYYGSASESFRGKLDGIKTAYYSGTNFLTGDTVTIGTQTYYVAITQTTNVTSFPSRAILLRTA
ncbi:MAG: hypothetical protein H6Q70_529 [Firmicutes bacterium]|nr:hypothetical protein [Bacillota bacterium]